MSKPSAFVSVLGLPIVLLLAMLVLLGGCSQNRTVIIDATPVDRVAEQAAVNRSVPAKATPTLNVPAGKSAPAAAPTASSANPFGLLLGADGIDDQYRVELAKALGVIYFRPWYVNVETWNGACYDLACDLGPNAGLKLILTARNNVNEAPPFATTPPKDGAAYRRNLSEILTRYKPEVLVVENEEDSAQYWAGTSEQYGALLKTACQVAHDQKIACANGGLSNKTLALLVWADYIEHQQMTEACNFVQRTASVLAPDLCRFTAIEHLSDEDKAALNIGRKLLEIYKSSGQDYLNFHWYVPDKSAFSEAVNYLRRVSNLPVMSNELGQLDLSTDAVQKLLSAAVELKLTYAIWFSLDRDPAVALQNADGSLRPNGQAFRDFMQLHYNTVAELPSLPTLVPTLTSLPNFASKPAPVAASGELTFSQVLRDVTYCTNDGVDLKMDVYFPWKPAGPSPVIMFVHGGGWVAGTKTGTPGMSYFLELARRGYTTFSIDYRLAPTYTFPAQIIDVKCAVRSIRAHAQDYNIDPKRIGAWGASAGGHLVALLGTADQSAGWDVGQYLDQSSRVNVVVDMYGVHDFTTEYVVGNLRGLDRMVFGASSPTDPKLAQASPVSYISPDDPPFLLLHGDMDETIPVTQSQIFQDRLVAGGVSSIFIVVHNAGHGFGAVGGPIDPPYATISKTILGFFDQYLR
ncbi:MAG TPA: alpha/beta hydrolase fold domain-containing protein [Anaerolineae bacterium]|nr:alpha/beta hydrolase fold domain-containing protein [Anaerolineae bacterium]